MFSPDIPHATHNTILSIITRYVVISSSFSFSKYNNYFLQVFKISLYKTLNFKRRKVSQVSDYTDYCLDVVTPCILVEFKKKHCE